MQLRTFYTMVVLCPLAVLGVLAVLIREDGELAAGLGPGGTAQWLYPTSAVRGLLAYGIVAIWLIRALYRRPATDFQRLLWLAPLAYAAAHIAVLAPLVLIQGRAAEFLSEQGGLVALRVLVRLLVGFGYVGLVVLLRKQLWPGRVLDAQ